MAENLTISGISDDSRKILKNELFFIIPRKNFDIFSVLPKIEPKVAVFVAESSASSKLKKIIKTKPVVYVKNIQKEFVRAVDLFYEFKNNDLKVIGVTGTNGKTTTSTLIYYLLNKLGAKTSLVSTVDYHIGQKIYPADNTTPGFLALRKLLKEAKDSGSRFLVTEVSSHAIEQERIKGIDFYRCLFTNLGRDHLDYHKTLKNYFKAKEKLFWDNRKSPSVINVDDPYGMRLLRRLNQALAYGTKEISDFKITNISLNPFGSSFDLEYNKRLYTLKTRLCGRHNVFNTAAAFALIVSLGFEPQEVAEQVESFNSVEGRLERVGDNIFVDYAHTPDALETVLLALRDMGYHQIICVFGCGGDRDKGKRKMMGQIAGQLADSNIVTSDNPRSEEPKEICSQIEKGFKTKNYKVIIDRKKAIEEAVRLLIENKVISGAKQEKNCLLVAGKGHEDYQIIGPRRVAFKDSEVIRKILRTAN